MEVKQQGEQEVVVVGEGVGVVEGGQLQFLREDWVVHFLVVLKCKNLHMHRLASGTKKETWMSVQNNLCTWGFIVVVGVLFIVVAWIFLNSSLIFTCLI